MTKISNQYSLTNILTADLANSRLGINNVSPAYSLDLTGTARVSGANTTNRGQLSIQSNNASNAARVSFYYDTTLQGNIGTTGSDFYSESVNSYLFLAGSSERMRITSTGNVGIGTTSPTYKLDVAGTQRIGGISLPFLDFKTSDTVGAGYQYKQISYSDSTNAELYNIGYNYPNLQFLVAGTRVMTLTSGGNVLIGGTTTLGAGGTNLEISGGRAQLVVNSTTATASWFTVYPAGDGNTYILRNTGYSYLFGTATNQTTAGFVQQMSISSNGSIGAPSGTNIYNASDVRLKKNISTTTYGLDTISALNPVKFNWVDGFEPSEDGKDMLGFVAQEVQAVLPEAVESFGGNSVTIGDTIIDNPLRVNEKFIIPVLVKAIQELSAKVSLLENK